MESTECRISVFSKLNGMRLLSILFSVVFFSTAFTQTGTIKGTVTDRGKPYSFLAVAVPYTFFATETNFLGEYVLDSVPVGLVQVVVWESEYEKKHPKQAFKSVTVTAGDTVELNFEVEFYCPYDEHEDDKRCPTCQRKRDVVPIVYGLYIGEVPMKRGHPAIYLGSCGITDCDPTWYCYKDRTKF